MRTGHQNELAFLKEMVRQGDGESGHRLIARLHIVERQEQRSRRWLAWLCLAVLGLVWGAGLATGDPRLLLEQAEHPISQVVFWIGGAALFGLVLVLGCWLRCRKLLRDWARDAQRFVAGWLSLVSDTKRPECTRRRRAWPPLGWGGAGNRSRCGAKNQRMSRS
jgi:hypothetical protein